jgi:hypothetical protein
MQIIHSTFIWRVCKGEPMAKQKPIRLALVALAITTCLPATTASAQAMRTYVSGAGRDGNPCSASLPCQTLQTAIGLTAAGGEVYVLDSANYGPVTINKAITITSEGSVAGLLATSGTGIVIDAGATDVVNLRGLDIDGMRSGSVGIQFNSGQSLNIQKTMIRNFTSSGILFTGNGTNTLFISDAVVSNNAGSGIAVQAGAGTVKGALSRVTVAGSDVGILASGSNVSLAITDTVSNGNNYGIAASASTVTIRNSTIVQNSVGISAYQSSVVAVAQSALTANGTGWQATNSGQLVSYSNNSVSGNTTDGAPSSTIALE